MPKHSTAADTGPAQPTDRNPPLPDLTGLDLRSLRLLDLDEDGLTAAVDSALRQPGELGETWYSDGSVGHP
ncbi:hypothetical protein ACFP1Z_32160 [Streptomyces gamaensis]|uniref:FXSXX-COOH protein n=1 Tax=Streptomyces gamaensis TaxID=1763542 RepID=A0ABW0Z8T1_9ACTN